MKVAIIGVLLIQVIIILAQPIDDFAAIERDVDLQPEIEEPEVDEPQTISTENTTIEPPTEETEQTEQTEQTEETEQTEQTEETTDPPTSTTEELETDEPPVLCDEGVAFLPAPQCTDYYMCLYGVGILKTCPDGLYWDPSLNICNWDASRCDNGLPESQCTNGVQFLPVESDCTQYIQCVHNSPIQMTCPHNLFWNQPLQRCDYECEI